MMTRPVDRNALIAALCDPHTYPHDADGVELIETHISLVFLAGRWAYKLKKPVDLGFLDFSSLARRKHYCEEELRLNRRLAPGLYRDVVPITRAGDGLCVGGTGEVVEYAVRMRRFEQADQLDRQLADDQLTGDDMDKVALHIAAFHAGAAIARSDTPWGSVAAVAKPVRDNFATLEPVLAHTPAAADLARLARWRDVRQGELADAFEARRAAGFVRECHGDLHLRNMARVDGEIFAFDGIEFASELRWIDILSDSAFLLMDLVSRGRPDLGWRFLNGWLERTGDYTGLPLLSWYLVYRHLVRAKVDAIRRAQADVQPVEADTLMRRIRQHVALALDVIAPRSPAIIITHGLSGSGKSWLAHRLAAHLPAIAVRSDIERKRMHGLAETDRPSGPTLRALYAAQARRATYERLAALAGEITDAGYTVILDAAFLARGERDLIRAIARDRGLRFLILAVSAEQSTLEQRIAERSIVGRDPSDAGLDVLHAQIADYDPLEPDELADSIAVRTDRPLDPGDLAGMIGRRIMEDSDRAH